MTLLRIAVASLALAAAPAADRSDGQPIIEERAIAHGISPSWMVSIVGCESRWNQYAVGRQGELGPAQLHPRGELQGFYARGYTDPYDWWQAGDYLAVRLAEGGARAWVCS
jgi:Soluble lytic murein transglycosylase and related regulatory proteins (some contain LysM/invasin domains)